MGTRIAKGFSMCTAIVGILCLLTGIGIAICAWVLNGQLPNGFRFEDNEGKTGTVTIGNYWWGGMIYVLPGILGIIAGCRRSVAAMVLYLVFNLICCICSLVIVVMCGLILLIWVNIDKMLQSRVCHKLMTDVGCICDDPGMGKFTLYGGDCEVFSHIHAIIGAMVSLAAISSLLSFIASYISCCALCNKESTDVGTIITTGGAGVYQPPPIVVQNTTGYPAQQGYPPPPYATQEPPPYNPYYPPPAPNNAYPMPYATNNDSRDNLMKNEYH